MQKPSLTLTLRNMDSVHSTLVCKIPLLARRTRPSAARDDRVSCIQIPRMDVHLTINFKNCARIFSVGGRYTYSSDPV